MKFNRSNLTPQQRGAFVFAAGTDFRRVAPDSFPLLPVGEWNGFTNMGTQEAKPLAITESMLQSAVAYQQKRLQLNPDKKLVIDYEHQTLSGDVAPAAGWISSLSIKDGWLHANGVSWTAKAKGFIESGEYKYYSPMFAFNYTDKVSGQKIPLAVLGCGLTNEPFLDEVGDLGLLQAAKSGIPQLYQFTSITRENNTMNTLLAVLATLFGVEATSEESVFVAKADGFIEQMKHLGVTVKDGSQFTAETILDHLKSVDTELKTMKANYAQVAKANGAVETDTPEKIIALSAKNADTGIVALRIELNALKSERANEQAEALVDGAFKKGKMITDSKPKYLALAKRDLNACKEMLDLIPEYSIVPLNKIETSKESVTANEDGQPSVETIQAYAEKNKLSFKDAAIVLTMKG